MKGGSVLPGGQQESEDAQIVCWCADHRIEYLIAVTPGCGDGLPALLSAVSPDRRTQPRYAARDASSGPY
jgi:hypothetical protein